MCSWCGLTLQATVEKIYKVLTVDGKGVRKYEWNNKEVNMILLLSLLSDEKELCSITQLVEEGVTPQYSFEITFFS
ncbi:hypothetical protein DFJ58DRAFT_191093 [Suillus subalutaceus]|uniref:uncharacterized protein n=1 Tax=Suillus subalutaceus TaxID=48586 RepID=UPI001B86A7C3|nr:uncharacterized protein DFJ58DRAFT_191093 [Suillus subalutaceus]KAG1836083.1 hypothetical protein DFJ58DRAFT_191093 [Suillus subalutaceus]